MPGTRQRPMLLVLAPPDPGPLDEALGAERAAAVRRLLHERALAWARQVGRVEVVPAGVELATAATRAGDGGRLLIVWPVLAEWDPGHAAAAIGDLDDGCGVSVGPVFDGGLYVLALARPMPELLALELGPEAMSQALAAVHTAGLEVGLMRSERGLSTVADVRAALADPLLDGELRRLLR